MLSGGAVDALGFPADPWFFKIAPAARDHAIAEGFLVVDPATVIATHANQALLAEAHQLLGPDEVREWVDGLKARAPALVEVHNRPELALFLARRFPAIPVALFLHNARLGPTPVILETPK